MTQSPNGSGMPAGQAGLAVEVDELTHSYPSRRLQPLRIALQSVSFQVRTGEIFGLLGPNGSGKSTLFRILNTLIKPAGGNARIFGHDVISNPELVRQVIGVVFQDPSLDKKLTVQENLSYQGNLYGLRGKALEQRVKESIERMDLADRSNDLVEHLSGGLQRRAELAKAFLHGPQLLLLDEPSTGLDPGARREFGDYLHALRNQTRVTVLMTTHILDDAERCDRIAILDQGKLVAIGTPQDLKHEIGGDVISVSTKEPAILAEQIRQKFSLKPLVVNGSVRIERNNGHAFIPQLVEAFPGQIDAVTLSKPTLEDVFIHKTGHRLWEE